LVIIWLAVDAPKVYAPDRLSNRYWTCASTNRTFETTMVCLLIAYNFILMAAGTFLAIQTRKVQISFLLL